MSRGQTLTTAAVLVPNTIGPAPADPAAGPPAKPRTKGRHRNVPLRDEHGELRGTVEVSTVRTPPDQRARFTSAARMLHQLWFIDRPSPLWIDNQQPTAVRRTTSTDSTHTKETA